MLWENVSGPQLGVMVWDLVCFRLFLLGANVIWVTGESWRKKKVGLILSLLCLASVCLSTDCRKLNPGTRQWETGSFTACPVWLVKKCLCFLSKVCIMIRNLTRERILTVQGLPLMFPPVLRYSLAPTVHRSDIIAMLEPRLHLNSLPLKLKWIIIIHGFWLMQEIIY